MNQIQYNQIQILLADMISLRDEDPATEALPHELDYYIGEISRILKVPIPTKSCKELREELPSEKERKFFEELKLE